MFPRHITESERSCSQGKRKDLGLFRDQYYKIIILMLSIFYSCLIKLIARGTFIFYVKFYYALLTLTYLTKVHQSLYESGVLHMAQQQQNIVEALVSFLRPQHRPLQHTVQIANFDYFCRAVIARLPGIRQNQVNPLCNILNGLAGNNLRPLTNFCSCSISFNVNTSSFSDFLESLKQGWGSIQNNCRRQQNCRTISFLLDTCYDQNKASRLENALNLLGSNTFRGNNSDHLTFLLLLISNYTEMIRDPRIVAELEWFPVLARAAVNNIARGQNTYLPLCPGKGDVAALLYYVRLNRRLMSTLNNISIGANNIDDIVRRLILL